MAEQQKGLPMQTAILQPEYSERKQNLAALSFCAVKPFCCSPIHGRCFGEQSWKTRKVRSSYAPPNG
jgi:hypothetical protein